MILSVVGFGLGQSGSALATGATDLFIWRLVTGVFLGGCLPSCLRAVGIGWAKSVGRIGTVIAPLLIGLGLSAGMAGTTVMSAFALPAVVAALSLAALAALMARRAA